MQDKINVEVTINREELVKALKPALTDVRSIETNLMNHKIRLAVMEYIWFIKNGVKQIRRSKMSVTIRKCRKCRRATRHENGTCCICRGR